MARVEELKQCSKLLQFFLSNKEAEPFLEPVDWKGWNLLDYPKVIKTPMDLRTVKRKLDAHEYSSAKEFKHDVNLVFVNSMTYNQDGSPYYNIAASLKDTFEEKYAKFIKEEEGAQDAHRPPTLVDKKMFSQNIYNIGAEDLGRVVQVLDQRCEAAIKKIDPEDIEIDIDTIDPESFWLLDAHIKSVMPGGKGSKKGGAKGAGAASADKASAPKKARVA